MVVIARQYNPPRSYLFTTGFCNYYKFCFFIYLFHLCFCIVVDFNIKIVSLLVNRMNLVIMGSVVDLSNLCS